MEIVRHVNGQKYDSLQNLVVANSVLSDLVTAALKRNSNVREEKSKDESTRILIQIRHV